MLYGGLAAAGLAVAASAVGYRIFVEESRIGPGFLPLVARLLLAVLASVLLVKQMRAPRAEQEPSHEDVDHTGRTTEQRTRVLRRVFALLFVTLLAVQYLGIVLAFGLLVLVISTWLEGRRPLPAVLMSATSAAAMYVVFAVFLRVPLPTGVFGF
ncbi:MAG: tripartite tricarboxylate transporter TctB family protein [Pseudonocardiaceae bacterium]|nr:tripartite tricarboxylate transporter TctB family protein [Pseudonocardiaceae bacterium]